MGKKTSDAVKILMKRYIGKDSKKLESLSKERRVLLEKIRDLRNRIGPIDFDIAEELRELRNG